MSVRPRGHPRTSTAELSASAAGVGIVGREGRQASLAADFSVPQFSHLPRLLRMCTSAPQPANQPTSTTWRGVCTCTSDAGGGGGVTSLARSQQLCVALHRSPPASLARLTLLSLCVSVCVCVYVLCCGCGPDKRSAKLSHFVIHRGLIISLMQAVYSGVSGFAPIALYQVQRPPPKLLRVPLTQGAGGSQGFLMVGCVMPVQGRVHQAIVL
jgi:hypothetical protein